LRTRLGRRSLTGECLLTCAESVTLGSAVSLATSTAVHLLPQKVVLHNRKYFVFCASAEVSVPFSDGAQPMRAGVRVSTEQSVCFCARVGDAAPVREKDEERVRS
jgi:hypothetical protein